MTADSILTDDSMIPGVPPAAATPAPILDQLEISIWKGLNQADSILPIFEEHFGKPEKTMDGQAWRWKQLSLSMTTHESWAYRVIRFPAAQSVLAALSSVLKRFPDKEDGKPAVLLRSAEIAWDFSISHIDEEPESQLQKIAAMTIPANKKAKLRKKSSDYLYECSDGAVNGLTTFYFQSLSLYPEKEDAASQDDEDGSLAAEEGDAQFSWLPSKTAVWRGKAYCKRLAPKTPWCLRFEVTLLGQKIEKVIGKALPADLTLLPGPLARLCFDDFWSFERFDWPAFMEAARRSAKCKGIPFAKIEKEANFRYPLTRPDGVGVTMWQVDLAKRIAAKIGSDKLRRNIGSKKFSTPMSLTEVLSKNSSGK